MVAAAGILSQLPFNFFSGAAFGSGYGAGIRLGYEDIYPKIKPAIGDFIQFLADQKSAFDTRPRTENPRNDRGGNPQTPSPAPAVPPPTSSPKPQPRINPRNNDPKKPKPGQPNPGATITPMPTISPQDQALIDEMRKQLIASDRRAAEALAKYKRTRIYSHFTRYRRAIVHSQQLYKNLARVLAKYGHKLPPRRTLK
jgi:hypothetical protein